MTCGVFTMRLDGGEGCGTWFGNEVGEGKGAFEAWDDKTAWSITEIDITHAFVSHEDLSPTIELQPHMQWTYIMGISMSLMVASG